MDYSLWEKFLTSNDSLNIYEAGRLIFTSDKSGLLPLLDYIDRSPAPWPPVVIFDKIMGNGAALLSVLANGQEVYSPLGSHLAQKTLDKYHIGYHISEVVPYIQKTPGGEMCPMERLSLDKDPQEFYAAVKNITDTRPTKI